MRAAPDPDKVSTNRVTFTEWQGCVPSGSLNNKSSRADERPGHMKSQTEDKEGAVNLTSRVSFVFKKKKLFVYSNFYAM